MKAELVARCVSLDCLRRDAIERGMVDLALAYGWCLLRLKEQLITLALREG